MSHFSLRIHILPYMYVHIFSDMKTSIVLQFVLYSSTTHTNCLTPDHAPTHVMVTMTIMPPVNKYVRMYQHTNVIHMQ